MQRYKNLYNAIRNATKGIFSPHFQRTFIYGILLYTIALFAIFRGDVYYMDDIQNSVINGQWNHYSRYLASFLIADILPFFKGTIDLSPLPQIFSCVFMVLSSMILVQRMRGKLDLWGILASLPLGLSPHLLQLFSYKFDSVLLLAVFFAILPFLFKGRIFVVISILSLLCSLNIYQAGSAIYILLCLYFAFSMLFFEGKNITQTLRFMCACAVSLIVALLLYKLIANPIDSYASDKMINFRGGGKILLSHIWIYLKWLFDDFKQTPYIVLVALNCVLFIINAVLDSNRGKILALFCAIAFIVCGICMSYGLYLLLERQSFEPRYFFGFGAFVAVVSIFNVSSSNKILRCVAYVLAVVMAYFLISFANIYGNALTKQEQYLQFRAELLLKDLSVAIPLNANAMVDLRINLKYHLATQAFINKYGGISRLIPKVAKNDWWFYLRLRHLNAPYNFDYTDMCKFMEERFDGRIVLENIYHKVRLVKNCYIVDVKG